MLLDKESFMTELRTDLFRCQKCNYRCVLAIGYPANAPHGENRDCTSNSWELIVGEDQEDTWAVR